MRKITMTMAAVVLSAGFIFTGCSGDPSKPQSQITQVPQTIQESSSIEAETQKAVEPMTVSFNTKIYENEQFSIEVPESWTVDDQFNPLAIVSIYDETKATEKFMPNITLTSQDDMPDDVYALKKYLDKEMEAQAVDYGITILTSEVMERSFGKVLYVESSTELTEENIDKWIEEGFVTEEQLEQGGGKENMLDRMNACSSQIQIYVKKEGLPGIMITLSFADVSIDEMKQAALYIAETLKAK